ncbi:MULTISPECIES: general secretion pathway protein GspE [unclassified Corallococcus]|uniref:GspE/PulE/PilB domain-containing protein n=1 Tax=unclassified Corallococcus TaxID=2685029 RepID=UPI001A8D4C0C|nr:MULTISPECIES: general secretion pathway protein GspE [unclassified Corallococcus]MBN9685989.1 general secretion pathway protein GspE [Corallococcus sp. NCSPR001]WAS89419.1 general secretion pathway protein GspE [Corallococcus sp. NCRR]
MRLGELLVKDGLVSAAGLEEALESQVVHGGRLGTNLVELGLLSEQDLAKALGRLHNCAYASGEMVPDPKAVALVNPNEADDKEYLPMRADATRLSVAVVNPHDFTTLDAIAFKTGKRVVPVVIPEFRMNQLLRRHAKAFRQLRAIDMNAVRPRPAKGAAAELQKAAERPPDLMSEEEFQSVYAQALRGGSDAEADVLEGEIIITGEEVVEAPVATPPQGRPAMPAQARPGAPVPPRVDIPAHIAPSVPVQGVPAQAARAASTVGQGAPKQGVPSHVAAQAGAQGVPAHVVAQAGAQGVPAHVAAQAGAAGAMPPGAAPNPPVAAMPVAPPPTPLTFPEAQAELGRSSDREDVARTVLRFAMGKWRRCLLLSVQGNLVTGWHGMGQGVSDEGVRRIGVPLRDQSTFRLVRDLRSHFVGPVKRDAAMGMFYRLIGGGFPSTAVILPLLVRGKVVHLLYVDNGAEQFTPPDVGELLILSQGVGRSYEAMMRRRKSA